jgi:hypothetical protein
VFRGDGLAIDFAMVVASDPKSRIISTVVRRKPRWSTPRGASANP